MQLFGALICLYSSSFSWSFENFAKFFLKFPFILVLFSVCLLVLIGEVIRYYREYILFFVLTAWWSHWSKSIESAIALSSFSLFSWCFCFLHVYVWHVNVIDKILTNKKSNWLIGLLVDGLTHPWTITCRFQLRGCAVNIEEILQCQSSRRSWCNIQRYRTPAWYLVTSSRFTSCRTFDRNRPTGRKRFFLENETETETNCSEFWKSCRRFSEPKRILFSTWAGS